MTRHCRHPLASIFVSVGFTAFLIAAAQAQGEARVSHTVEPLPALAQGADAVCGPRDGIVAQLRGDYAENRAGAGLSSLRSNMPGFMFEVWRNAGTGTWTITITGPDGITCGLGWGTDWHDYDAPVADTGA